MNNLRINELQCSRGWLAVGSALLLFCAMMSPDLSRAAELPKDPCVEILAKPGTGGSGSISGKLEQATTTAAEHLAKGANPLATTTGVAGDYYLDPSAVEMLPPGGRRVVCWMARYERTLRDLATKLAGYQYDFGYRCVPPRTGRAQDVEKDRNDILGFINRMPTMAEPGRNNANPRGAGGWVWAYLWEIRDYTNSAEIKRARVKLDEVRQHIDAYQNELKPCAQVPGQGASTSTREYSVWIAGNDVLVGQSDVLRAEVSCRLKGWGNNCDLTVGAALQKQGKDLERVAGLYNSFDEARDFYCRALEEASKGEDTKPRVVPLTGGRDWTAKLSFSDRRVNIKNAPDCK